MKTKYYRIKTSFPETLKYEIWWGTLTNSRPQFEKQFRNRVNPWRLCWSQNLASNFLDPVSRKTFIWNIQTAASETFFFGKTSLQKCKLMCSIFRKAWDRPKSVSLHNECEKFILFGFQNKLSQVSCSFLVSCFERWRSKHLLHLPLDNL